MRFGVRLVGWRPEKQFGVMERRHRCGTLFAIIYECFSALCTVGLSFGITPTLCWQSKLVLSLMMYMGRIGMLTIPLAFKTKNIPSSIEYIDAKITVG